MKGRSTRRHGGRTNNGGDQVSLLANPSPPSSPSPYGAFSGVSTVSQKTPAQKNPTAAQSLSRTSLQQNASTLSLEQSSSMNSHHSQVPLENRFLPQHDPKENTRQVQSASMALQFVPAYEESTTRRVLNKSPVVDASWDAIIEADDNSSGGNRSRGRSWSNPRRKSKDRSLSSEKSGSSKKSASSSRFRRSRSSQELTKRSTSKSASPEKKTVKEQHPEVAAAAAPAAQQQRRGPRMARLSKIFSNRPAAAAHKQQQSTEPTAVTRTQVRPPVRKSPSPKQTTVPPSPSRSSVSGSSSGYVGWPGTQDKRGGTVAIQSSYDDSSVGAAAFHQRRKQANLDDSDLEVTRKWADSSFDESSTGAGEKNKLTPLEQRMDHPEIYGSQEHDDDDDSEDEEENPADFHLKALVANSTAAASPMAKGAGPSSRTRVTNGYNNRDGTLSRDRVQRVARPGPSGRVRSAKSVASASRAGESSVAASAAGSISISNLFENDVTGRAPSAATEPVYRGDPWDIDSSPHPTSSPGTSVSKTSSAYFDVRDTAGMAIPTLDGKRQAYPYGVKPNMRANAAAVMRRKGRDQAREQPQPPTEAALAQQERSSPSPRPVNAENLRGYRGFYDKTKDMPNLIDAVDSESVSSRATSTFSTNAVPPPTRAAHPQPARIEEASSSDVFESESDVFESESDVFDGITAFKVDQTVSAAQDRKKAQDTHVDRRPYEKLNDVSGDGVADLNLVMLGGGLTAIQTTPDAYQQRRTATDFDEDLTNSDVGQYPFSRIPGFNKVASAGRQVPDKTERAHATPRRRDESPYDRLPASVREQLSSGGRIAPRTMFDSTMITRSESGESYATDPLRGGRSYDVGDLSEYRVNPKQTKRLVKRYRELCPADLDYITEEEYQKEEDAKKAFALQEMRSRIVEKDIERGLERQGGTVVVDDIVTTPYYQAAQRIRDAVIVSKAWRDGASPRDVITASLLTRREERTYCIKRPVPYRTSPRSSPGSSNGGDVQWMSYTLEPVTWVDDVDFMQLRCPSLGPRCMRGFEMFTIGDCQSILLKLTNEHCLSLRWELNDATARQIEAEETMREEGDAEDGMMTEAEMTFLTSMEEVKNISRKLVVAEKSFNLVRDRIEKLVAKYEALLVKIDTESTYAPSSIVTLESSYYSDGGYTSEEDREKEQLARRAQRAELRAELAAREAMLAKQEAEKIRQEKQRELEVLQQKLNELQSESSLAIAEREHSMILARAITTNGESRSVHDPGVKPKIDQEKVDSVKRKFRDRVAARMQSSESSHASSSRPYSPATASYSSSKGGASSLYHHYEQQQKRPPLAAPRKSNKYGVSGEEMVNHLDFYERSLKAVEDARATLLKHQAR